MELKGENLAKIKKTLESNYSIEWAIKILVSAVKYLEFFDQILFYFI
jgi:hypothetical protein